MSIHKRWLCIIIFSAFICQLKAQDADSLLLSSSDTTTLSYSDSLSIFYLIDSLLTIEENTLGSQLAVRMNYNSNVLSTGRTLGIDQFGLSPGVSFYHTSGLYADVSSFWSNDFDPKYYLTILSAGYTHLFSSKFSLTGNYDHYFYNLPDDYVPYTNGIVISPVLDLKYFTIQCDYTYYFGEANANRIMPSMSINLSKKKLFRLDKVSFNPAFYLLFGDESFTEILLPSTRAEWIRAYIRMQQGLTWYTTNTYTEFGVMNYSFSFPINIQYKKFNLYVSYIYSVPKALPSETLLLPETGFVSAGITYLINLKKNKPPF